MSAYDLRQNLNEWTNIEVSIDNINNKISLFVNGQQEKFAAGADTEYDTNDTKSLVIKSSRRFTKRPSSSKNPKFVVGGQEDASKRFTGKMERFEISNKKSNAATALAKYQELRTRAKDSMFNMKFSRTNGREISDRSKYKTQARFEKTTAGAELTVDSGREVVKFQNGDFIQMDAPTTMFGNKLLNSTFTSWIKTPIGYNPATYEPIIGREHVFSFGLNNGHASLFLSKNNQLMPGTNITKEVAVSTVGQAVNTVMETDNENLLVDANFNTINSRITTPSTSEYSSIIPGSKAVKMTQSDKIEVDKLSIIGKDLNKFTFSGWVNFSSLNDNAILFERPDAGMKLSVNAGGQVSLQYNQPPPTIINNIYFTSSHTAYNWSGITYVKTENNTYVYAKMGSTGDSSTFIGYNYRTRQWVNIGSGHPHYVSSGTDGILHISSQGDTYKNIGTVANPYYT